MKAAVITQPGSVELATVDDPAPGPREVVVAVAATGLCGTDLHILQGEFAPKLPIIPGHEFAGEVVGRGSEVTELALGDQVAVDPSLYCFDCHYCRLGHNNLCERWAAIGLTHPGAAAEYAVAPAANCVRLPDHVDAQDAALIEPLSCAVRGYDVLRSRLASRVPPKPPVAKRSALMSTTSTLAAPVIDPRVFISDRLPLAAFPDAVARFQAGTGRKIQIQPGLATA